METDKTKTSINFDIETAAEALNVKLKKLNSNFFGIGDDMIAVRKNYTVPEFRKYLKLINLERTNASRYMECAKSDRLKKFREQLNHITCWTTIDKIRILSPEDFEFFKLKHLSGDKPAKIRGRDVDACNSSVRNRPRVQVIKMQPITISPKQSEFSQDVLDQLLEQMGQINNLPGVTLMLPDNIKSEIDTIIDTPDDVSESTVYDNRMDLLEGANDNAKQAEWMKEWKGMPEYQQDNKKPFKKLIVKFSCQEDVDDFAERIDQELTDKTSSIHHPKLERDNNSEKRWA